LDRRQFLRIGSAIAAGAIVESSFFGRALADPLAAHARARGGPGPYGPLLAPDANGIALPAGFRSRLLARSREPVAGTGYVWHMLPDGGATFRTDDGWIYVSNSEMFVAGLNASVSAIRFDRSGEIVAAYPICEGTTFNCAGGATPWGTWITCEEHAQGRAFECDPTGVAPAVERAALGTFQHEAVACDWRLGPLYLTEDQRDGRLYRFTPAGWRDLSEGVLEVARVGPEGLVTWMRLRDPNPSAVSGTPTRHQVPESTGFDGGEGVVYHDGHVYFTTKGDHRVWDYETRSQRLRILYDAQRDPARQLTGVDNITASRSGDLFVAEDGGNMEVVILTPEGVASPLLRIVGQDGSEITGPAFDPSGERLYLSSQRAFHVGATYEVSGPFRRMPA
jgi:secreted PhoX family phosphatase